MASYPLQPVRTSQSPCSDHVVGAILSGWRYDISGISPDLRRDYESHLDECLHCRSKQRLHRSIDLLLFVATTLSFSAFLLATLVLHRLRALNHFTSLHLRLPSEAVLVHTHIPTSITVSLQAVTGLGVLASLLLWVLVAVATPAPDMVSDMLREKMAHDPRERFGKQAA